MSPYIDDCHLPLQEIDYFLAATNIFDGSHRKYRYFRRFMWAAKNYTQFHRPIYGHWKLSYFQWVFPIGPSNILGPPEIENFPTLARPAHSCTLGPVTHATCPPKNPPAQAATFRCPPVPHSARRWRLPIASRHRCLRLLQSLPCRI
jgi:hypothetical protein